MATLQSVSNIVQLRSVAIDCWNVFIQTLDTSTVGTILNQAVLALLRSVDEYTITERLAVSKIFKYLVIDQFDPLKEHLQQICFLPSYPEFKDVNDVLHREQSKLSIGDKIENVLKGVSHENGNVTKQSLLDLKSILQTEKERIYGNLLSKVTDKTGSKIISILLETSRRYNGSDHDIQRIASECLGILGALDPDRVDVKTPANKRSLYIDELSSSNGVFEFVRILILHHFVPGFRSAKSSKLLGFLAVAIQELLKICGCTSKIISRDASAIDYLSVDERQIREWWDKFPKSVIETIRPLVDTKYYAPSAPIANIIGPIFSTKNTFQEWIRTWTIDLIGKVSGDNAQRVFSLCRNLIRTLDVHFSEFLLPHLVLNVLTQGRDADCQNIVDEFVAVLSTCQMNGSVNEKSQMGSQVYVVVFFPLFFFPFLLFLLIS